MKYVITNDFSKLYDSFEEAQREYNRQVEELTGLKKGAFKLMYTVAPYYL